MQQQGDLGGRPGEPGTGLVVPVQNGEGDSLNLSAGFIQVLLAACPTCNSDKEKSQACNINKKEHDLQHQSRT